jgi:hypothetical protein
MPDLPSYLQQLPGILTSARRARPLPFFHRHDIEALFGLRRRQAVALMHKIGAIRAGNALAVEQRDLVRWVERVMQDPAVVREPERRARVVETLVELKAETAARAVKISLPDAPPAPGLPEGVAISAGVLTIRFDNTQQLLERLFGLARSLAAHPASLGIPFPLET